MFRPLVLCVGLRYTRAKRHNHFISFIATSSMLGIALGVAVLITVLSVMNGFDEQIKERFFSLAPQVTVSNLQNAIPDWQKLSGQVQQHKQVLAAAPYVGGQGLLARDNFNSPVILSGILPQAESKVSAIKSLMEKGALSDLTPGSFNIILGRTLAQRLLAQVGDKIRVMVPKATISPFGLHPQFKVFTVAGIFYAGSGFGFDNQFAFLHLSDAQKLFLLGNKVSGLRLKVDDVFAAPQIAVDLEKRLPADYQVGDWTDQFGAFFKAIKMEKNMMFLILLLIIAVAAFNLVSSLVMVVTDKRSDIAILRTLGALPSTILKIFMLQGCIVGFVGTTLGLIGGLLMAKNATVIATTLQNVLHVQILSKSVYFIDYLPSKIESTDIILVCALALLMSFLAALYPAWRAARTQPAEALRYD